MRRGTRFFPAIVPVSIAKQKKRGIVGGKL
jgi:hypothetical protein